MADGDSDERPGDRIPIVGIGASAGGIYALSALFESMPPDTGAAFVVIVHLDPETKSELANILGSRTRLSVVQVQAHSALKPNCVYVIPPDRQLQISDHEVSAVPFDHPRGQRAPIDLFFRSLAQRHGDSFGIILSGAGSDGAGGVRAIKEQGGIILVQAPDEAEYPSMPNAAIATESADFVLPVRQMAERLVELLGEKGQAPVSRVRAVEEDQLRRILAHLRVRTGHDFTAYKKTTIVRRIQRRVQVSRTESLEGYLKFLRESADEPQALIADLLISVTQFFRDPKAFESLRRNAIARLFQTDTPRQNLRVWVVGCATGEEAYSIAMLLREEAALHDADPSIQVFATDLDARALAIAREGLYPVAVEADLSEQRLHRFFQKEGQHYRVRRELRDIVLFANHSVLRDPPFSRIDLLSCRNMLIYLDRDLQQQVLATLNYALTAGGYLFLGSSENADLPGSPFRPVDREARLYQSSGHIPHHLPPLAHATAPMEPDSANRTPPLAPAHARVTHADHARALETLAPPSILVDSAFHVVHLSEHAGRYLLPSAGPLTADVAELVRPELRFELRAALHRAFEGNETTLSGALYVQFNGKAARVYMHVKPLKAEDATPARTLVLFIEGEEQEPVSGDLVQLGKEDLHHLRQELSRAQKRLNTMRQESEAANEELRATNEELQSMNEEYRSTAEELETSKEELQSINEELLTVNTELKIKLESVSRSNSDLQNVLAATDLGILFLDPGLHIKRFTPRLADLFNVAPGDVGRPITDFTHQLDYQAFSQDARTVLESLQPLERELLSLKGRRYFVRFRPYRTIDDRIDGLIVTFVDISERRRIETALLASEEKMRGEMRLVDLSSAPIFVWDFATGIITQWNRGCEVLYGYARSEAVGMRIDSLKPDPSGLSFEALKETISAKKVWKGEIRHRAKNEKAVPTVSNIELLLSDGTQYVLESGLALE